MTPNAHRLPRHADLRLTPTQRQTAHDAALNAYHRAEARRWDREFAEVCRRERPPHRERRSA